MVEGDQLVIACMVVVVLAGSTEDPQRSPGRHVGSRLIISHATNAQGNVYPCAVAGTPGATTAPEAHVGRMHREADR